MGYFHGSFNTSGVMINMKRIVLRFVIHSDYHNFTCCTPMVKSLFIITRMNKKSILVTGW